MVACRLFHIQVGKYSHDQYGQVKLNSPLLIPEWEKSQCYIKGDDVLVRSQYRKKRRLMIPAPILTLGHIRQVIPDPDHIVQIIFKF